MSITKTLELTVNERALLNMALNDRLHWLTKILRIEPSHDLVTETVAMLAKLDSIPVFPV